MAGVGGGSGINAGAKEGKADEGVQGEPVGTGWQWVAEEVAVKMGKPLARGVLVLGTGAMSPKKVTWPWPTQSCVSPGGLLRGAGPMCCHPIGGGSWGC